MANKPETIEAAAAKRDREFATAFLAMRFDPASNIAKRGIEILCHALERAREEGRQETLKREFG